VYAVSQVNDRIWVGGSFTTVDGGRSPGVAVWLLGTGTGVGEPGVLRRAGVEVNPNPFNPQTTIRFELEAPSAVDVTIFDPAGRRIRSILAGHQYDAGPRVVVWDGRDDTGAGVASGVYLVRVVAGEQVMHGKMALVR
jgi:flagellar hook assembly protein FlgD